MQPQFVRAFVLYGRKKFYNIGPLLAAAVAAMAAVVATRCSPESTVLSWTLLAVRT